MTEMWRIEKATPVGRKTTWVAVGWVPVQGTADTPEAAVDRYRAVNLLARQSEVFRAGRRVYGSQPTR